MWDKLSSPCCNDLIMTLGGPRTYRHPTSINVLKAWYHYIRTSPHFFTSPQRHNLIFCSHHQSWHIFISGRFMKVDKSSSIVRKPFTLRVGLPGGPIGSSQVWRLMSEHLTHTQDLLWISAPVNMGRTQMQNHIQIPTISVTFYYWTLLVTVSVMTLKYAALTTGTWPPR